MRAAAKRLLSQLGLIAATSLVTVTLMGGGPAGAFNVPNNSVNSAKIVNNSVQGVDIRNNTVTSADIRNGTVNSFDIKNGTITVADVNRASLAQPRLAVLVDGASTVGTLQTRYSVGVGAVTNPQAGVFCIQPSPAIDLTGVIPTIGIEYWGTLEDDTVVWWVDPGQTPGFCPSGTFAVVATRSGTGEGRNNVAFTVRID